MSIIAGKIAPKPISQFLDCRRRSERLAGVSHALDDLSDDLRGFCVATIQDEGDQGASGSQPLEEYGTGHGCEDPNCPPAVECLEDLADPPLVSGRPEDL